MLRSITAILLVGVLAASSASAAPSPATCPVFPTPKVYRDQGQSWQLAQPEEAAIVVGAKATEPEQYAAERLQGLIRQRYKRTLPIVAEDKVPATVKQVFLLGQPSTNAWLARLCGEHKIELTESSPAPDGFVIECIEAAGKQIVMVGGSNPRGVIYGQDTLFDLIRLEGKQIVFPVVSVRDWPSIAWRGRPHSVLEHHLVPGALDAYVRARINFTDVRDNPSVKAVEYWPARKASMGFPAGVPIDRPPVKRMIDESHRRGLFVYGTVSCGGKDASADAVLKTFTELLELGVDGLWMSFDDSGSGDDSFEIARRVVEFGKSHGLTGRQIAITPPDPDYKVVASDFNRKCAAIPGMEAVQWMFTRVPCQADAQQAKEIGLKRLPGWWHNLEGFGGGFLHNGGVLCTLRADLKPAYVNLQTLANGWGKPDYEKIRDAAQNTDCALLWCICNGWPEEYFVAALGLWAWNPETHDWSALRDSVYRYVYGDGQVAVAREFDDKLAQLKSLYYMPEWNYMPNKGWPCRLNKKQDQPQALALIDQLQALAKTLSERAPVETGIDPTRLETTYLEPMRATVVYARKMTSLDYPEESQANLKNRVLDLMRSGNPDQARQMLDDVRPNVEKQLARISDELKGLKGIDGYVAYWRKQLSNVEYLQELGRTRPEWKLTKPIVTYYEGPSITTESAQLMKDGGWNLIWCKESELTTVIMATLKAMLRDDLLKPTTMEDPAKVAELKELIDRVKEHPALGAYFIVDEPNAATFPAIGKMVAFLKEHDPARLAYINLYPTYASNKQLGTTGDTVTAYQQYLDRFIEEVKPRLISYDNYLFFTAGDGGQYFLNLEMVRKTALKHNLPFLNIIQACSWEPSVRIPTADELRFLTYTTIAYGGQGLSHYVYNYPKNHTGMMVDNDGKPTDLYYAAKTLNPEFEKIATELMPYKSIGAYHVGTIPLGATALPATSAFKIQSDGLDELSAKPREAGKPAKGFVLGCFGKAGSQEPTHVVVVNLDYTKSVKATVTGPGKLEVFDPATKKWRPGNDSSAELDLLPGGGVLVRRADIK